MKLRTVFVSVVTLSAVILAGGALDAQKAKAKVVRSGYPVNRSLVGISLLDSGQRVLAVWGSPTKIEPVAMAGEESGGGGGGGGNPFGSPGGMSGGDSGTPPPPVAVSPGGAPGGAKGGGAGAMAMGGGGGGGFEGDVTTKYTRWIYNRGPVSYAFLIDDDNRVVQIDASGIVGSAVASGGIRLGSTFADVMRVYKKPDSYTFKGEFMELRFLKNSSVVFQFREDATSRLQRVFAITVAAGK